MGYIEQWQELVELIIGSTRGAMPRILDLLNTLYPDGSQQAAAPKALRKKLVQKQVPLKLWSACAMLLADTRVTAEAGAVLARATAAMLTATFGVCASSSGGSGSSGGSRSSADAPANTLNASTHLQLQQGLLTGLPAVLSVTSQQLKAATDALAPQAESGVQQAQQATPTDPALLSKASQVLRLVAMLLHLQPRGSYVPPIEMPGLILSSMRYLTSATAAQQRMQAAGPEQSEQQQQQPAMEEWREACRVLQAIWKDAAGVLLIGLLLLLAASKAPAVAGSAPASEGRTGCADRGSGGSGNGGRGSGGSGSSGRGGRSDGAASTSSAPLAHDSVVQLFSSEVCLQCLALAFIGSALPLAITPDHVTQQQQQQQQHDGGRSSNSSTSSTSSSSSSRTGGSASTQVAAADIGYPPALSADTAASPALPDSVVVPPEFDAVLQHVGGSAQLASDILTIPFRPDGNEADQPDSLSTMIDVYRLLALVHLQWAEQGLLSNQQLQQCAMLHALLCPALLKLAVLCAHPTQQHTECCNMACRSACMGLKIAVELEEFQVQHRSSSSSPQQQAELAVLANSAYALACGLLQQLLRLWPNALASLAAAYAPVADGPAAAAAAGSRHSITAENGEELYCIAGLMLGSISESASLLANSFCDLFKIRMSFSLEPQLAHLVSSEECSSSSSTAGSGGSSSGHNTCASGRSGVEAGELCSLLSHLVRAHIEAVKVLISCNSSSSSSGSSGGCSGCSGNVASAEAGIENDLQYAVNDVAGCLRRVAASSGAVKRLTSFVGAPPRPGPQELDSLQHRRLFDLLCSMLKLANLDNQQLLQHMGLNARDVLNTVCCVAQVAAKVVSGAAAADTAAAAGVDAAAPDAAAAAAGAAEGAAAGAADAASNTTAVLPWLVLLGRSCLHWAQWVPQLLAQQAAAETEDDWALGAAMDVTHAAVECALGRSKQQLAAWGYDTESMAAVVQQPLATEQLGAVGVAASSSEVDSTAVVEGLCAQLQALGEALTCFAFPLACNNPSCVNVSGPSEQMLVGGCSCICAGCLTARYCSRACHKQHWKKQHKPVCKALAAVRAANTPGVGS